MDAVAPPSTLLCLGAGYTAAALARRLDGWRVLGTSRDPQRRAAGFAGTVVPWADAPAALTEATHLLVSARPGPDGDPVLAALGDAVARAPLQQVLYLSATSVYGDRPGERCAEDDEPAPTTDWGRHRVAAERAWLATGLPVEILRLAAIYGPGRSALQRLDRPLVDAPDHPFSRIHVDDAAALLHAMIEAPQPGRIVNGADDEPAPSADVTEHAYALLGRTPPPRVPLTEALAGMSPMGRSFWSERRGLDLARRRQLRPALTYPTYREGLAAILRGRTPSS